MLGLMELDVSVFYHLLNSGCHAEEGLFDHWRDYLFSMDLLKVHNPEGAKDVWYRDTRTNTEQ